MGSVAVTKEGGSCEWFRFGLRGSEAEAVSLLNDHPMQARNIKVRESQVLTVNTILSNATDGELNIRYFRDLKATEYGFSCVVFKAVMEHLNDLGFIEWNANGTSKSTMTYGEGITMPTNIIYTPPRTIEASMQTKNNKKQRVKVKLNTTTKKALDSRIRAYWGFIKQHDIQHNIDKEAFDTIAEYRKVIEDKTTKPPFPNKQNICPVAVFNDRSLSIGGRFYRAFWIGMPKILRPLITIDKELTSDIDGRSMHVQLLYRKGGLPVPEGELYVYPKSDHRRKITKKLMLYMMNTRKDWQGDSGRVAVIKTYKKHNPVNEDLMPYIIELEKLHAPVRNLLYQSNWGELQCTEAGIMLRIMEAAMNENIVVLPVHDGCLCKRSHRDRVLELFLEQGIVAEENRKHLHQPDLEDMRWRTRKIKELKNPKKSVDQNRDSRIGIAQRQDRGRTQRNQISNHTL